MHNNTPIPVTQNEAWGFWNTMHAYADATWPLAVVAIAETTGESFDAARAFLDSRHGRHLADDVLTRLHMGDTPAEAVRFATVRWMHWTIDRKTSRDCDIPRGLPFLLGLTIHYGIAEEAMVD